MTRIRYTATGPARYTRAGPVAFPPVLFDGLYLG